MIDWKLIIGKYLKIFINAVIAGILLGISGLAYLYATGAGNQVLGSFLFGFGFLFIALYGYELYSNKSAYMIENKVPYLLDCLLAILGNIAGAWLVALLVKITTFTSEGSLLMVALDAMMKVKLQDALVFDYFGRSFLAGIIVYLSYNTYKKAEQPIARFLSIFLGAFLISFLSLDEFVTSMFFFDLGALEGYDMAHLTTNLVYIFIGNTLGALLIPALRKLKGVLSR